MSSPIVQQISPIKLELSMKQLQRYLTSKNASLLANSSANLDLCANIKLNRPRFSDAITGKKIARKCVSLSKFLVDTANKKDFNYLKEERRV